MENADAEDEDQDEDEDEDEDMYGPRAAGRALLAVTAEDVVGCPAAARLAPCTDAALIASLSEAVQEAPETLMFGRAAYGRLGKEWETRVRENRIMGGTRGSCARAVPVPVSRRLADTNVVREILGLPAETPMMKLPQHMISDSGNLEAIARSRMYRRLGTLGAYLIETEAAPALLHSVVAGPTATAGNGQRRRPGVAAAAAFRRLAEEVDELDVAPLAGSVAARDRRAELDRLWSGPERGPANKLGSVTLSGLSAYAAAFADPISLPGRAMDQEALVQAMVDFPLDKETLDAALARIASERRKRQGQGRTGSRGISGEESRSRSGHRGGADRRQADSAGEESDSNRSEGDESEEDEDEDEDEDEGEAARRTAKRRRITAGSSRTYGGNRTDSEAEDAGGGGGVDGDI